MTWGEKIRLDEMEGSVSAPLFDPIDLFAAIAAAGAQTIIRATVNAGSKELVHMTSSAGANAIQGSGKLIGRNGIFALPQSAASRGPIANALLTGIPPSKTAAVISIPSSATSAFSRVIPIGPYSLLKAVGGVRYAAPGAIDLVTGTVTRTGSSWAPRLAIYGPDLIGWTWAAAAKIYVEEATKR